MNAQEVYAVVEELSQFSNICPCITSRSTTIPATCETLDILTLSVETARDTFYQICKNRGQPDPVDGILGQLDFHAPSIALLATVAHRSRWDPIDCIGNAKESGRVRFAHGTTIAV